MKYLIAKHGLSRGTDRRDEALIYIDGEIMVDVIHSFAIDKWLKNQDLTIEFVDDSLRQLLLTHKIPRKLKEILLTLNINVSEINNTNIDETMQQIIKYLQQSSNSIIKHKLIEELFQEDYRQSLLNNVDLPLAFGHVINGDIPKVYIETKNLINVDINTVINSVLKYYNNRVEIFDDDSPQYKKLANMIVNIDDDISTLMQRHTHRDIPMKFGLTFEEYDKNINTDGCVDKSYSPNSFPWDFEQPCDNMEFRLKDQGIANM